MGSTKGITIDPCRFAKHARLLGTKRNDLARLHADAESETPFMRWHRMGLSGTAVGVSLARKGMIREEVTRTVWSGTRPQSSLIVASGVISCLRRPTAHRSSTRGSAGFVGNFVGKLSATGREWKG